MKKSDIKEMPEYFDRYIDQVADVELSKAFDDGIEYLSNLDKKLLENIGDKRYAPDKWTTKEVIQHITDWERILTFRALLFARKEGSIPQGIDENLFAQNLNMEKRTVKSLIEELKIVRLSTKAMYESFDDEILQNIGVNWKSEISVLAMGFAIAGHQKHHFRIIEERYFPLSEESQYENKNC